MDERDVLTQQFEASRNHLRAVAYRMLGSEAEADDAVQEAWLRLHRADVSGVDNLGGWLTTVVARVCLDMLRARKTSRQEPAGVHLPEELPDREPAADPEHEALLADAVGMAMLVVLDRLPPAERVAFVLHDVFAVPFEEVAQVVGRTPAAARQLASRGRRRVQGAGGPPEMEPARRRQVVAAFLAAARRGDFGALLALLDPDVVMRADARAVHLGAPAESRGAAVVGQFCGRAQGAQVALVDGVPALVWAPGGKPRVVFDMAVEDGRIIAVNLVADPDRLARLDLVILPE